MLVLALIRLVLHRDDARRGWIKHAKLETLLLNQEMTAFFYSMLNLFILFQLYLTNKNNSYFAKLNINSKPIYFSTRENDASLKGIARLYIMRKDIIKKKFTI